MSYQTLIMQTLTILLPVIGVGLPGIFKQDGLSPQINSLIAFVLVLVVAGVQAWAAGQLGINPFLDFPLVAGVMSALLAGPLRQLDEYMQSNVGLGTKALPPPTVRAATANWQNRPRGNNTPPPPTATG